MRILAPNTAFTGQVGRDYFRDGICDSPSVQQFEYYAQAGYNFDESPTIGTETDSLGPVDSDADELNDEPADGESTPAESEDLDSQADAQPVMPARNGTTQEWVDFAGHFNINVDGMGRDEIIKLFDDAAL